MSKKNKSKKNCHNNKSKSMPKTALMQKEQPVKKKNKIKMANGNIKQWFKNVLGKTKSFFAKMWYYIKSLPLYTVNFFYKIKQKTKDLLIGAKKQLSSNKKLYAILHKTKEFFMVLDEKRAVSYPILILVYSVVLVGVTVAADRAMLSGSIPVSTEQQIVKEMESTPALTTLQVLLKDQVCVVSNKCSVEYCGSVFENKINPSKAEEFGSYFENHNESNTYMDVVVMYKNTSDLPVRGDETIKMTSRCDTTEYKCFTAIETDDGKNIEISNYVEIAPGESARVHCIFDVPKGTYDNCQNIMAELVTDNKLYIIDVK